MQVLKIQLARVFVPLGLLLLTSCGGGGGAGGSTDAVSPLVSCATNPTATITGTVDDIKIPFAGQTFIGRICVTGSGCANHTSLTIDPDGLNGSVSGGSYRFKVVAVCKNSSYPGDLYVSGTWSDGTDFENATFTPATLTIRYMTLPANSGYFYI